MIKKLLCIVLFSVASQVACLGDLSRIKEHMHSQYSTAGIGRQRVISVSPLAMHEQSAASENTLQEQAEEVSDTSCGEIELEEALCVAVTLEALCCFLGF